MEERVERSRDIQGRRVKVPWDESQSFLLAVVQDMMCWMEVV